MPLSACYQYGVEGARWPSASLVSRSCWGSNIASAYDAGSMTRSKFPPLEEGGEPAVGRPNREKRWGLGHRQEDRDCKTVNLNGDWGN